MTMPSKARRLGNAFRLGVIYAAGATAAMDEAKWITVHPNGTGTAGRGNSMTLPFKANRPSSAKEYDSCL